MSETISIPLDQIHVPEDYVRPLDESEARKLARYIEHEGQKAPIAVYRSAARQGGEKPYTLIYGARRLRAMAILERSHIDAILHSMAEAPTVALVDSFAVTTLVLLEQGEHLFRFVDWWMEKNGPIKRGGDRRSKFHTETLIDKKKNLEKSSIYEYLAAKLNISRSKAWRLLKIGSLDRSLRDALRGTRYADDNKWLEKLTKLKTPEQQQSVADDFAITGDLAATLRKGDPTTGREPVGRQETGDWREAAFLKAWEELPRERREAGLAKIGAMTKPLDPWPVDLPEVRVVPAPGNDSPLRDMLRDPYARLSRKLTYEQVMKLKAQYEEEARELERYMKGVQANIEEQEKARQAEFAAERERAEAKKARAMLKRTGTYKELPAREKEMLAELDGSLQQALDDSMGRRHADLVRACHALDGARQAAMADVLYRGCDKDLAKEYAAGLLADQRAKPRGAGRREVTMPLLVARKGPEKGILPQLWKRVKAMRGVLGMQTGFLKNLTPERQSFVCDLLNRNIPEDHILLYARKLSSGEGNRRKFRDAVITGDITPEEIPAWLNQIDFEPPSKPVERDFERT